MSDCGIGGEDCSLCMVSAVAPAKWIRWMLVQEDPDPPNIIRVARGAPARWINSRTPFGISHAPTRQGQVSFSLARAAQGLTGTVSFAPNAGQQPIQRDGGRRLISVRVGIPGARVAVAAHGATVLSVDQLEGSALFHCEGAGFNFTASDVTSSLTDAHSAPRSHGGVPLKHDDAAPSELRTYLLLDSRNVQDSGGAKLVLGPVRKRPGGQPVLTEQKKWEMRYLLRTISIATYLYPHSFFDARHLLMLPLLCGAGMTTCSRTYSSTGMPASGAHGTRR